MKLVMKLNRKESKIYGRPIRTYVQSRNWKQIFVRSIKAVRSHRMLNISSNSCRKFMIEALAELRNGKLS